MQGKCHGEKGKVMNKTWSLTNDPDLQAEGMAEEISEKIQEKFGQVE